MSIEFYSWRDGGGEYAAVVRPTPTGAHIALFGDEVTAYQALLIKAVTPAQVRWIQTEYSLDNGYAAVMYDEVVKDTGPIPGVGMSTNVYLIVADGQLYAVTL